MIEAIDLASRLRALEESLLDPAVRRDRTRLESLLAADFLEFGASGRVWNREAVVEHLAQESGTTTTLDDFHCVELSADATLVTWRAIRTDGTTGRRSVSLRSSIWVKEDGEWRVGLHQGTPAT